MRRSISFTLNGKPVQLTVDDDRMLLWVLRYDLGLTGTKFGCGAALCGSCTVIVNDEAVRSCVTAVKDIVGKHVLTIESLSREGALAPDPGSLPQSPRLPVRVLHARDDCQRLCAPP